MANFFRRSVQYLINELYHGLFKTIHELGLEFIKRPPLIPLSFLLNMLTVLLACTAYVPDEYWQSLEVAHVLAFNYGFLTWEWKKGIRSYLYPSIIAAVYKVQEWNGFDEFPYMVLIPRFVQSLLASAAYIRYCRWFSKVTGYSSLWAFFSLSSSWYMLYAGPRTLTNSVETFLTMIALTYYPWPNGGEINERNEVKFLSIIALACAVRPTAIILWIPLLLCQIWTSRNKIELIKQYLFQGCLMLFMMTAFDSYMAGRFICAPFNFFYYNLVKGVGNFYGTQSLFWYVTSGFPMITGLHIFTFALQCWAICKKSSEIRGYTLQGMLLITITWTLFVYSCLSHKEARFIMPILPLVLFLSASQIANLAQKLPRLIMVIFVLTMIAANTCAFLYLGMVHQSGTFKLMNYLSEDIPKANNASLLFLMPCHSMPSYSQLHKDIPMRTLLCEPPEVDESYVDEAELFYQDPNKWLNAEYDENSVVPSHIIFYDVILKDILPFLIKQQYKKSIRIFHTHFPQSRTSKYILVWKCIKHLEKKGKPYAFHLFN